MLIDIRHVNFPLSDALHDFTERRVSRALRPFREAVSRVEVRNRDVNGPRGGIDVECSITVDLAGLDQPVVVAGKGADAYAATVNACGRLHEAVSRALGRRRRVERTAPPPSGGEAASPNEVHDVVITTADHERLRQLIRASRDTRDSGAADTLAEELDSAEIMPADHVPGNVVTMNSRVVFRDEETGENREVSLVYPQDSDPAQGRISIFAPVGTALLGLSVGQTIDWPLPQGRLRRYRVVEVVYQPEAAGHLHL